MMKVMLRTIQVMMKLMNPMHLAALSLQPWALHVPQPTTLLYLPVFT